MFVFANDGESCWIVEHVGESLGGEEASTNEGRLLGVPKGIVGLVQLRNDSSFKVLFGEVLDDVVTVGEGLHIPPVAVTDLSVDYFNEDCPLLHLKLLFVLLLVLQHHFDAH